MNFWKTNEFQKVNGELINSVIDTMTGDSNVDDKVMLVTNFFGHLRCCQKLWWLRSQYKESVINIWNLSPKHFVSSIDLSPIKILKRIYIFSDKDLFLCFEFCSTSYLGTHTTEQRRDYTKQIFDFYNENFPGISIYKGKNFENIFTFLVWPKTCDILKVRTIWIIRHESCRLRFKILDKETQAKSNLMNSLEHFWMGNFTKRIVQIFVTFMSLKKRYGNNFNHCWKSMLFLPNLNIQIIMVQEISFTECLTSLEQKELLIPPKYIFNNLLVNPLAET